MVSKTGEAESITSHYLFALGSYRGLYILNWIYRSRQIPSVAVVASMDHNFDIFLLLTIYSLPRHESSNVSDLAF
jgi:hypothetical protein